MHLQAIPVARTAAQPVHWLFSLLCALLLSMSLLPSAHAQSAANGKVLYNTNPSGGTSCSNTGCHGAQNGTTLVNRSGLGNGANNPSKIQSAINNTGGMNV